MVLASFRPEKVFGYGNNLKIRPLPSLFNVAVYFIDRHASEGRGGRTAIECGDEKGTYDQLVERVNGAGSGLRNLGMRREERVALLLLAPPEFSYCFFGTIKAGGIAVPLNTMLKPAEYEYLLNDCRARILVVSESVYPQVLAIPREKLLYLENIVIVGKGDHDTHAVNELMKVSSPELRADPTNKDDAAFWLYSSGSTGFPKGCVHLHHDMVVCAETYAKAVLGVHENDRLFSVAKMFFAYGLGNGLYFSLAVGATSILWPGSPAPPNIFQVIERHKPTLFFSVPSNYATLLSFHPDAGNPDFDLSTIRNAVSAGEALPAPIFHRFKDRFGVEVLDAIGSA